MKSAVSTNSLRQPAAEARRESSFLLKLDYAARLNLVNGVGRFPGYQFRRWVYRRIGGMTIGERSWIQRDLRVFCLGGISIGDYCSINGDCRLDGRRSLTIGSNVHLSVGTRILTLGHDAYSRDFALNGGPVTIGDRAWLGAWSLVLPDVTIGEGAVIGAGSVVTRDVAPYTIVAGNPARVIGERPRELDYQLEWAPLLQ